MYEVLCQLIVETDSLQIRPIDRFDLKEVYAIHCVEAVNEYLPYETWQNWNDALQWYDEVERRAAERSAVQYVLEEKVSKKLVGTCLVFGFQEHDSSLELGYVLSQPNWGKGIMLRAMRAFLQSLSNESTVLGVRAVVDTRNRASIALLDKLAFKRTDITENQVGDESGYFYRTL